MQAEQLVLLLGAGNDWKDLKRELVFFLCYKLSSTKMVKTDTTKKKVTVMRYLAQNNEV